MALLVNGELVTNAEIEQQRALLMQSLSGVVPITPETSARLEQLAQENAVCRTLLYQQASRSEIRIAPADLDTELARRRGTTQSTACSPGERSHLERELQVERFIEQVTRGTPRPSKREIEAEYGRTSSRFQMPERVHVQHIVRNVDEFSSEDKAMNIMLLALQELGKGVSFAGVADRYSDCAGFGGELGWITRGEMVDEFEEVVFRMRAGEVSRVFRTVFGFHIARVVERSDARMPSFSEVRPTLAREMYEERRQTVLMNFLRGLAARSDIRLVQDARGEAQ